MLRWIASFLLLLSAAAGLWPAGVRAEDDAPVLTGPIVDQTILPATSLWYAFDYPGDGSPFGVTIDYAPVPPGDTQATMLVGFNAYLPNDTYLGRSTDAGGPAGGRRFWLMSAGIGGRYWIEVVNHSYQPVVFSLTPAAERTPQAAPGPAPATVAPVVPASAADRIRIAEALGNPSLVVSRPGGASQQSAQTIVGDRMDGSVGPGESRWYRFWYSGLRGRALAGFDFGDTRVDQPDSPAVFVHGPDGQAIGRATNDHLPANQLAWSLDSDEYGYYWFEIRNPGPRGANYQLVLITGH